MTRDTHGIRNDNEFDLLDLDYALHRRILTFLNAASSAADLEFTKPLFVHDHEGLPIGGDQHHTALSRERLMDVDTAKQIIEIRNSNYPLGFRNLRELFLHEKFNRDHVGGLFDHLDERAFGKWETLVDSQIPMTGPDVPNEREIAGVVHAALLHTGKVLFITADQTTLIWNPEDLSPNGFEEPKNQPHLMPEGYSQLCSHHVFLSDGRLLVVGGGGYGSNPAAKWGYKFDPSKSTWERTSNPMSESKWYPTAIRLGDERVVVLCGHGSGEIDIYSEITDRFTPISLNLKAFPYLYPGLHLLPDSSFFYSRTGWGSAYPDGGPFRGDDQSAYFKLTKHNVGSWSSIQPSAADIADRTKGMSVLLLQENGKRARVMVFGGADVSTNDTFETIDVSNISNRSAWSAPVGVPDRQHRSLASAVLLPNGSVFISGGIRGSNSPCALFDPQSNSWHEAAELPSQRDYHSVSLLLPSGKVMMAGWENSQIEIYSPPYLFNGPQPRISNAPETVRHDEVFKVETPDAEAIAGAVLVRPSAVTHQTDTEQRVVELTVAFDPRLADQISITVPNGGIGNSFIPVGYYMLFILNHAGVPSIASWVRIVAAKWHTWFRIGRGQDVPIRSAVWSVSQNPDRADIFVVGHNGGIYTTGQTGRAAWDDWHPIGNPDAGENVPTNSIVTAISRKANRLDVFVVGHNGGVYSSGKTNGGTWDRWHPIGNPNAGENFPIHTTAWPVARNPDRIDIFAVGHNGGIYTNGQTNGGNWDGWRPVGNPSAGEVVPIRSNVCAVSSLPNRIDLFVVGNNGGIYSNGQTNGGVWAEWQPIGNPGAGDTVPTNSTVWAVSPRLGRIDVFVVGHNEGIYSNGQISGGAWEGWQPIGNPGAGDTVPIRSIVCAVSHVENRVDLTVVGFDGGIYTNGHTIGENWDIWRPIGDPTNGENVPTNTLVSAVSRKPGEIDIFTVGHNGGIYSNFWL